MKNTMKKILSDSLILTGIIVVTFLVGFFVISWVFGLLASVLSENQLVVRLCNFIPYFILVLAVLFTFAYKKEYKREAFSRRDVIITAVFTGVIMLVLALVITFAEYTTGPALILAKMIHAGKDVNMTLLHHEVPDKLYVICILLLDVFYVPAYVLGGYFGQKKRALDRQALTKKR